MFSSIRVLLRRALRRTPPQTELGWTRFDRGIPVAEAGDQRRVEYYNAKTDELSQVYAWSAEAVSVAERSHLYWREVPSSDVRGERPFRYFERSRTVFG